MKPACKSCAKEHETTFGGANRCGFHGSIKKQINRMKTRNLLLLLFLVAGCSQFETDSDINPKTDGLWIEIRGASMDNKTIYDEMITTSDIDYYDFSSHLIYLKKNKSFIKNIVTGSFCVYAGNEEIYKGSFQPGYSSAMATGVYIYTPRASYPDYVLDINWSGYPQGAVDPRTDPRIVKALKANNQYHEGLSCEIQSVRFLTNDRVELKFTLTNKDASFNYYYFDPDKMGFSLFHYFTNGPVFLNEENPEHYYHKGTVIHPDPWNLWKKEWLSLIKKGETKNFTIIYEFNLMPSGKYRVFFNFPGLSFVEQNDLVQNDGRIWMGEIGTSVECRK
jgi:hypothetical protein